MRVTKTIKTGQNGAQRFTRRYGKRLVNVRYREDRSTHSLYTTIELIVDRRELPLGITLTATPSRQQWVAVKVAYQEESLRGKIKASGGRWSKQHKVWIMMRRWATELGLADRVIPGLAAKIEDVDLYS